MLQMTFSIKDNINLYLPRRSLHFSRTKVDIENSLNIQDSNNKQVIDKPIRVMNSLTLVDKNSIEETKSRSSRKPFDKDLIQLPTVNDVSSSAQTVKKLSNSALNTPINMLLEYDAERFNREEKFPRKNKEILSSKKLKFDETTRSKQMKRRMKATLNNTLKSIASSADALPFPKLSATVNKGTKRVIFTKGLTTDWWYAVCFDQSVQNVKWHPLYPIIPFESSVTYQLSDDDFIKTGYIRRLYGFLFTNVSAIFEFRLQARDGIELILLDTNMTFESFTGFTNINKAKKILYMNISVQEMLRQDKVISYYAIFKSKIAEVKLKANKLYFIEILQGGANFGKMNIQWRRKNTNKAFETIKENNLFRVNNTLHNTTVKSVLQNINNLKLLYPVSKTEQNRQEFYKILPLSDNNVYQNGDICDPFTPEHKVNISRYEGITLLDRVLTYPRNFFNHTQWPKHHLLLNENEAVDVAKKVLKGLNKHYSK